MVLYLLSDICFENLSVLLFSDFSNEPSILFQCWKAFHGVGVCLEIIAVLLMLCNIRGLS